MHPKTMYLPLSAVYFGFMCDSWTLIIYEASLLALTAACALVTFRHEFDRPHWRKYRALLFAFMGFSGAIPVFHIVYRCAEAHLFPVVEN